MKAVVNDFKSYVKGKHLIARTTSGGTTLNSTTDLHLAFNNVDYVASGTKKTMYGRSKLLSLIHIILKHKHGKMP